MQGKYVTLRKYVIEYVWFVMKLEGRGLLCGVRKPTGGGEGCLNYLFNVECRC